MKKKIHKQQILNYICAANEICILNLNAHLVNIFILKVFQNQSNQNTNPSTHYIIDPIRITLFPSNAWHKEHRSSLSTQCRTYYNMQRQTTHFRNLPLIPLLAASSSPLHRRGNVHAVTFARIHVGKRRTTRREAPRKPYHREWQCNICCGRFLAAMRGAQST